MEGAKKLVPLVGGLLLLPFALGVVIVMLLSSLMGMDTQAAACAMSPANSGADQATFAWPTDKHEISQDWGVDPNAGTSHSGMDFDVSEGSKVYAAANGTVVSTSNNEIVIKHEQEVQTHYRYIKDFLVHAGDTVKRGQQIATSGSGNEDPPGLSGEHLHFEVWIDKESNGHLVNTQMKDNPFVVQDSGDSGGSCSCPTSSLTGNNNVQMVFNYFVANGYSKEQAAGVIGNMQTESYVEPTMLQGGKPGDVTHVADALKQSNLGWGIVQWTPSTKMINPSRASGADDKTIESLQFQLDFLRDQLLGKGPDPRKDGGDRLKAAKTVKDATIAFGQGFEGFGGNENLDSDNWRKRIADAQSAFGQYAGIAPAQGAADDTGGGGCGAAAGNGDIVKTALSLAWDTPGHGFDAKPAYPPAEKKYNGSTGEDELTDCGVFVATVMVMSGADPDYARRGTSIQIPYVRNSPKYEVFDNLTNEGQLKPGDIFLIDGHTYLYTGPYKGGDGKTYNAASASLHGHTPEASHVYFDDYRGHYMVARLKKSGA
ncbi:phage tail tip lysozyme [Kribbella karoonensis]|uniref:Peptidase M23-like protein n=1 Tax=Kribbella karoonensis TaxID=324851 RepID=A0ABN2DZQ5_9ACTN